MPRGGPLRTAADCAVLAVASTGAPAQTGGESSGAGMTLALTATGLRDYYCTVTLTLTLTLRGDEAVAVAVAVAEVNGHLVSEVEGERVGRSRGASFLDLSPGGRAEAVFETPDAPCEAVTAYRFVVGACLGEAGFLDRDECAAAIVPEAPVVEVSAR